MSVDPLTQSYPWYTPYQFAGNTPIQAIDLDGLEEKKVIGKLYLLSVDMKPVPKVFHSTSGRIVKTNYNVHGYGGNNLYFWEQFIKQYPDALDEWNKGQILVEGRSPRVTIELKANFKRLGVDVDHFKNGDIIDHHHVSQKSQAIPLARTEHKKIPTFNAKQLAAKFGKTANSLGAVSGALGIMTGNPDSWLSWFDSSLKLGSIKKAPEDGVYYTPVKITADDFIGEVYYNIYNSFNWDDELKKYVGSELIGYGYKYEEASGYSENKTYNLDGELIEIESQGVRSNH